MVPRNSIAVLTIAALLLAALVPVLSIVLCAVAIILSVPPAHSAPLRAVVRCDEQSVALRALTLFRAPPSVG